MMPKMMSRLGLLEDDVGFGVKRGLAGPHALHFRHPAVKILGLRQDEARFLNVQRAAGCKQGAQTATAVGGLQSVENVEEAVDRVVHGLARRR